MKPYHPDFSVNLLNLTAMPDGKLTGPPEVTAAMWSLKYARTEIEKALHHSCIVFEGKYYEYHGNAH